MDFVKLFYSIVTALVFIPMISFWLICLIPEKFFGRKDKEEYDKKIEQLKAENNDLSKKVKLLSDENTNYKKQNESLKDEINKKSPSITTQKPQLKSPTTHENKYNSIALRYLRRAASNEQDIDGIFKSICNGRLNTLFETDLYIKELNITSTIGSGDHYYRNVTLTECSCPDFKYSHTPCKHMLYLIYSLGILQLYRDKCYKTDPWIQKIHALDKQKTDLQKDIKNAQIRKKQIESKIKELDTKVVAYDNILESYKQNIEEIAEMKCSGYPYLAGMLSDYKTLFYAQSAEHLRTKRRPAPNEALRIETLRIEAKRIEEEKSVLEYRLGYIYELYPEIKQIFDDNFDYKNKPPLEQLKRT